LSASLPSQAGHLNARERVENASVIDELGEWAASTSIHGVSHAFDCKYNSSPKRIVRIFLVLASFGTMICAFVPFYCSETR
jgi:hypothetical protein